jgi:hypothetical protein
MKFKISTLIVILLFTAVQLVKAQDEPTKPEEPEEPEFSFDFDFQNFPRMSEDDEKELLKNFKENLRKELEVIKEVNKNKYFEFLRESQFKNLKIPFLVKRERVIHERERKIFEAEIKAEAIAVKYENASETEKKKLKEDLQRELVNLFNQKEERRREEVEQLEKELKELKKSLAIRQKNKKEIIDRRLQELLDEDQYLDWD